MIEYMDVNIILDKLSKSKFRSSFHLTKKMKSYIDEKGMDTVKKNKQLYELYLNMMSKRD